ncbi:LapA family protein [Pseudodesulfovibrio thermohalotolerans]|uniref:LapA family protein n=1 Tax=Pseudodesulfovibrio thermohalotolerans TaxID=2880651 RepID=UPI00244107BA|nr:LapA family protein [Pseudodesulfovibrio thermohalotolerans]WFS63156.1 LapA family protein [Pseudodesulfovibrio thermohalotolerans]
MNQSQTQTKTITWRKIRLGAIITLVVLWIVFLLQNTEQTQVSFLWLTFTTSRILLLLGTLFVGAALGAFLTYRFCARGKKSKTMPPQYS